MMHRYFTISNFLSASRIFLAFPMGYCLVTDFHHHRLWAAGIIAIAIVTDFLDGFIARKLHQVTEIGKIIDPLADKIVIGIYALLLAWTGDIPLWFVSIVLFRDLIIFLGGMYIQKRKKIVPQSNWPGKISVSLIAFVFFLGTLQMVVLQKILIFAMWVSLVMMVWSVWNYAQRLFIGRHIEVNK
jgi:CDP-diacylglycerol--glycerol-3-phosphate 3-phosphatidyltransferase